LKNSHIYEAYASIKTAAWPSDFKSFDLKYVDKRQVCAVGKALDEVSGIHSDKAFSILDKCVENPSWCSFYLEELVKNPESRNLATNVYDRLKADANLELEYSLKDGFKIKANLPLPLRIQ